MIKRGYFKGRVLTMALASTLILGTVPEAALTVHAESIEDTQICDESESSEDNSDETNSSEENESSDNSDEGTDNNDENKTEEETGSENEGQSGNEDGSDDENRSGEEENEDDEDEQGNDEAEDAVGEETTDEDGEEESEETPELALWEDTSELSEEELEFYNNYTLTDEDKAAIENGEITLKELIQKRMSEAEQIEEPEVADEDDDTATASEDFTWDGNTITEYKGTATEVVIPAKATGIASNAFKNRTTITKVDMSESAVKEIGYEAFYGCTALNSVTLSSGLQRIDSGAFANTGLTSITIPKSVNSVGSYSWEDGNGPFVGTNSLATVEFESGMISVPANIFKGSSIENVTIPSSVKTIEKYAFTNCSALKSINLPSSLTYIGRKAFAGSGLTGAVTIPDSVTEIGFESFADIRTLTEVHLSSRLQKIDSGAFANTGLTSVFIPKSVNSVGSYSWEDGNGPFAGTNSLAAVEFESGMISVPANIFKGSSIENVTIPSSVKTIEKYAFTNCSNLKTISLPSNLTYIGRKAFAGSGLTGAVTIPDSVTEIGFESFADIRTLTEVHLSSRLQKIDSGAFANTGLTSVFIPKSVNSVGSYSWEDGNGPFAGTNSLAAVELESGMISVPANIFKGSSIENVTIPSSVKTIEKYAFTNCSALKSISLPSNLTYIGRKAFAGSGLTGTLTIPENVTEIADYAFYNCTYLELVELGTKVTKLGSGIWNGCSFAKLKVIKGTNTEKTLCNKGYGALIQYYNGPEYSISYVLNGGTNNSSNPSKYYWATSASLKNPTRPGYTFQGWYTSNTYKTRVTSIAKGSSGDKTFYAKWAANKYTVKFNANGGKGTTKSMTCTYDQNYKLNAAKCTKKGYSFEGWTTAKNGSGKVYTNCEQIKNLTAQNKGTVTLYAKWNKINYRITYNLNGGKNGSNPATYTVTGTFKLNSAYKQGYTFKGWYKDAKCKSKVSKIAKNSTGNKTFYAKFTGNKYSVSFNANGGNGQMAKVSGTYSDGKVLPGNTMTNSNENLVFAGWNTKADGTGTHYDDGASLAAFATAEKKAKAVTLYAEWVEAPTE